MNTSEHEEDDRTSDSAVALLRKAFDAPQPRRSLLPSIQERIRVHTRGRYYRKSSSPLRSPTLLLLAVGCFVLVLAAVLYFTIGALLAKPAPSLKNSSPATEQRN